MRQVRRLPRAELDRRSALRRADSRSIASAAARRAAAKLACTTDARTRRLTGAAAHSTKAEDARRRRRRHRRWRRSATRAVTRPRGDEAIRAPTRCPKEIERRVFRHARPDEGHGRSAEAAASGAERHVRDPSRRLGAAARVGVGSAERRRAAALAFGGAATKDSNRVGRAPFGVVRACRSRSRRSTVHENVGAMLARAQRGGVDTRNAPVRPPALGAVRRAGRAARATPGETTAATVGAPPRRAPLRLRRASSPIDHGDKRGWRARPRDRDRTMRYGSATRARGDRSRAVVAGRRRRASRARRADADATRRPGRRAPTALRRAARVVARGALLCRRAAVVVCALQLLCGADAAAQHGAHAHFVSRAEALPRGVEADLEGDLPANHRARRHLRRRRALRALCAALPKILDVAPDSKGAIVTSGGDDIWRRHGIRRRDGRG